MSARIEKVKRSFQYMDLEGLKKNLTYDDTLFQTSNRHFYAIIAHLFNQFKDKGETFLYISEGVGEDDYGHKRPAYRFIGNNFKNYFEFIIFGSGNNNLSIEVDEKIEYSEIKFFKVIRSKLKIDNELILETNPNFEEYLEEDIISDTYLSKLQDDFFDIQDLPKFNLKVEIDNDILKDIEDGNEKQ